MKRSLKILTLLTILVSSSSLLAQPNAEMADLMRSNGKIYVVVLVLCIIFLGLALYLMWLDRRLSKLEKEEGL